MISDSITVFLFSWEISCTIWQHLYLDLWWVSVQYGN